MDYGPEVSEYAGKRVGVYGGKFYPFHRGHLSFILKAQSMVDVLFVAVQFDEGFERALIADGSEFTWVDPRVREGWIAETLKPFPNIRVLSQFEHRSDQFMDDPLLVGTYRELLEMVGGHVDVIFSNTHEYDDYFARYLPDSEHVVFYEERSVFQISATQIRDEGVYKHWGQLPATVQSFYRKRVAVCGIESSGKSHISNMLAAQFNTVAVPEWGRLFYDRRNAYSSVDDPADYVDIAAGHVHLLNEAHREASQPVLFSDTDMIYTQFFHELSYGRKHPVLDAMIRAKADKIDAWLWLEPHEDHELDGTRLVVSDTARQRNRDHLFGLYEEYGVKLVVVDEPDRDMRYQKAVEAVNKLFMI